MGEGATIVEVPCTEDIGLGVSSTKVGVWLAGPELCSWVDPDVVFLLVTALSVVGPDIGFGVSPFVVGLVVVKVDKVESAIIVGVSLLVVDESSFVCVGVALSTFRDTCVV